MWLTRHVKGTKQIDRVKLQLTQHVKGFDVTANSTRKAGPNKLIELQGFMQLIRHVKGPNKLIELQGFMQLTRHVKGTKQIDRVTGVYVANSTRKGDQTN